MTQLKPVNLLQVDRRDFRLGMKVFAPKRIELGPVLLAYEGGFLTIESGDRVAVMHATGNWTGRAVFSPDVLRALATYPPNDPTVVVSYADGHLLIGGLTIRCEWKSVTKATVEHLTDLTLLDLLALERTMPRVDVRGTAQGRKVQRARQTADGRMQKAAGYLSELGITLKDIQEMVEARITKRIEAGNIGDKTTNKSPPGS